MLLYGIDQNKVEVNWSAMLKSQTVPLGQTQVLL